MVRITRHGFLIAQGIFSTTLIMRMYVSLHLPTRCIDSLWSKANFCRHSSRTATSTHSALILRSTFYSAGEINCRFGISASVVVCANSTQAQWTVSGVILVVCLWGLVLALWSPFMMFATIGHCWHCVRRTLNLFIRSCSLQINPSTFYLLIRSR